MDSFSPGLSELERRAAIAYLKSGATNEPGAIETVEHEGLRYVRLTNINGTLAVYRIRVVNGAEVLKGLKRWPDAIDH